jgi:hypothetical protein
MLVATQQKEVKEIKAAKIIYQALIETAEVNHIKERLRKSYKACEFIKSSFFAYLRKFREIHKFLSISWDLEKQKLL